MLINNFKKRFLVYNKAILYWRGIEFLESDQNQQTTKGIKIEYNEFKEELKFLIWNKNMSWYDDQQIQKYRKKRIAAALPGI